MSDPLEDAIAGIPQAVGSQPPQRPATATSATQQSTAGGLDDLFDNGPSVPVEVGSSVVEDEFPSGTTVSLKFAFVGLGQGGGSIAASFYPLGYRAVCAFNSTDQDFKGLPDEMPKVSINLGGCQKQSDIAEAAMAEMGNQEELRSLLTKSWGTDIDYAFVCVGLGGGTGSGSVGKAIEIAKEHMVSIGKDPKNVGVIASLPVAGDSPQVARNALKGLRRIGETKCSPVLLLDNAKIQRTYKPSVSKIYSTGIQQVCRTLHAINVMSSHDSVLASVDKSELLHILGGGVMSLGSLRIENPAQPGSVADEIRDKLQNSILCDLDLSTGKQGVLMLRGSSQLMDTLSADQFQAGFDQLKRMVSKSEDALIHRGVYEGGSGTVLNGLVALSGFDLPKDAMQSLMQEANMKATGGQSLSDYVKMT